jgi:outer membrane protein assembly factor BamE (lipoprotein component of BamABCDE complex)
MKYLAKFLLIVGLVIIFSTSFTALAQNSAASAQNQASVYSVSYNSFANVKVGMTISEAAKALGTRLIREANQDDSCYYVTPNNNFKGVAFMMTNKRIARIDINNKSYATERGARVGDAESRIKQLYKGMVKVSRHPYDERGHYLQIDIKGTKYSMIFETDGKRVTSYRVGKREEVGYIEGCS